MNEDITIPPVREDGLQLEESRRLQNLFWSLQRVSWVIFGLICIAALLGFTGGGGMFQKQTLQFAGAEVEIPRISRWEGSDDMSIRFTEPDLPREVFIGQPFFDKFSIERIQPEPVENALAPDGQRMRFGVDGPAPHQVGIDMRSMHFGWAEFELVIGGEARTVRTLVLP